MDRLRHDRLTLETENLKLTAMNPENLTTHALGEPLSPADREALEQSLQSDAQARADFEATQAFSSFLQQNLATEHPEATLTDEQKQRLAALATATPESSARLRLAQKEGDPTRRPAALRWLTRAALPLSAAALIVLGFQQWQSEAQSAPVLEDMHERKGLLATREGGEKAVAEFKFNESDQLRLLVPDQPKA